MKVVAIVQARTGSTRLPGKALLDVGGEPMLARVVARCGRARSIDEIVVATTVEPADEAIASLCAARGWAVHRGSERDVLARYHEAAVKRRAGGVVRITSDCPFIDPDIADWVVGELVRPPVADYASNTLPPRTFPRGLDVEAFRFEALDAAFREDHDMARREHVTPFLYRHPERFALRRVAADADRSSFRWTVDTPEDMELARTVYAHFGHDHFSWRDVLAAFEAHPEWAQINRHVVQKGVA